MWKGHIKQDHTIVVTHFGPLGLKQETKMKNDFQKFKNKFWNDLLQNIGIGSQTDFDNMKKSNRDSKTKEAMDFIEKQYLAIRAEKLRKIDSTKSILQGIIEVLFGAAKEGIDLIAMLTKSAAPTAAKLLLKEVSTIVLKQIAKEIAAIGAKQSGKSFAKKVPVAGLFVGAALGAWRIAQGDPGRAVMEVASGAASCVPGAGTAASVAIDLSIAGIDITEAIQEYEGRRTRFLEHSSTLENLLTELEKLDNQYDKIKKAYNEFDYQDDIDGLLYAIEYIPW